MFATTIEPSHDDLVMELIDKGFVKNKAKYMDWVETLARKELQARGLKLEALKVRRL